MRVIDNPKPMPIVGLKYGYRLSVVDSVNKSYNWLSPSQKNQFHISFPRAHDLDNTTISELENMLETVYKYAIANYDQLREVRTMVLDSTGEIVSYNQTGIR